MKKIIFSLGCLLTVGASYAQVNNTKLNANQLPHQLLVNNELNNYKAPAANHGIQKAVGTVVWSDNFSTAANWTIDNNGQTAADRGWSIGTSGTVWTTMGGLSSAINSSSGGSFAKLQNGSFSNQATGVVYTLTNATPIDLDALANTNQVNLRFEQFGARFNDVQEVQISTDGTTFSTVYSNNNRDYYNGTNASAIYGNPEVIIVDISSFLTAPTLTTVYVRFRWTSNYTGTEPGQWTSFGWKIDDVAFITKNDNDIQVTSSYWGTENLKYYQIPTTQVSTIDFSANVKNVGKNALINPTFTVESNGGVWSESGTVASIAPNGTDSLFTTAYSVPNTVGTYNITRAVVHDSIDDDATNNMLSGFSFAVTDHIFARDNDARDGYTFVNDSTQYEVGNYFELVQNQTLYGVDVVLHANSDVDAEFYAVLYKEVAGGATYTDVMSFIAETDIAQVVPSMLGQVTTLQFPNPVSLNTTDVYYLVVVSTDGLLNIATGGSSEGFSYMWNNNTLGLQSLTPIIRMNFDPTLGLKTNDEVLNGVSIFPNPATEKATVEFNLANASNVSVEVTDITGKVVETVSLSNVAAGANKADLNTAGYASGMYSVVIKSNDASVTRKLVVR